MPAGRRSHPATASYVKRPVPTTATIDRSLPHEGSSYVPARRSCSARTEHPRRRAVATRGRHPRVPAGTGPWPCTTRKCHPGVELTQRAFHLKACGTTKPRPHWSDGVLHPHGSRTPQNDRFALYSPRNPDRRWIRAKRTQPPACQGSDPRSCADRRLFAQPGAPHSASPSVHAASPVQPGRVGGDPGSCASATRGSASRRATEASSDRAGGGLGFVVKSISSDPAAATRASRVKAAS